MFDFVHIENSNHWLELIEYTIYICLAMRVCHSIFADSFGIIEFRVNYPATN